MEARLLEEGTLNVIVVEGRLDVNSAPKLDKIAEELHDKGKVNIAVDLEGCDFISSAGLRVIVAMQKRAAKRGSLVFRGVQPTVMDVFSMTGFDNILVFE